MSADGDRPGREVAYRLLAAEYDDATLSHTESDEERAPNYVITPTGARVNRLFVVGTLTEVTSVNEDMLRARVVDPTGAFVVYAGQYQPDALAALESLEPPTFVAVTGKARTFQPDDSEQVYTSIRPESIATVDADTRDRWVIDAAERTHDRIETYAAAAAVDADGGALTEALFEAGLDRSAAVGVALARDHYDTTPAYLDALGTLATEAVEVVAGEREQVGSLDVEPDATGAGGATFADLAGDADLAVDATAGADATPDTRPDEAETGGTDADGVEPGEPDEASEPPAEPESALESESGTGDGSEPVGEADPDPDGDPEPDAGLDPDVDAESASEDAVEPEQSEPVGATASESGQSDATDEQEAPADTDAGTVSFDEGDDVEESADDELGDFDGGGMYEMDDEEREQIEAEFGAEFTTGTDVDEPGEADIDGPDDPAEDEETDDDAAADTDGEGAPEPGDELAGDSADEEADDSADEEIDLQERAVETMTDLDDGDGADRAAVVETVAEETGASESAVEEAIQEALMGGQCYEPDDETLKAI